MYNRSDYSSAARKRWHVSLRPTWYKVELLPSQDQARLWNISPILRVTIRRKEENSERKRIILGILSIFLWRTVTIVFIMAEYIKVSYFTDHTMNSGEEIKPSFMKNYMSWLFKLTHVKWMGHEMKSEPIRKQLKG